MNGRPARARAAQPPDRRRNKAGRYQAEQEKLGSDVEAAAGRQALLPYELAEIGEFDDVGFIQPAPGCDLGKELERIESATQPVGVHQARDADQESGTAQVAPPAFPVSPAPAAGLATKPPCSSRYAIGEVSRQDNRTQNE